MSKYLFLYKERYSDDRDCVKYISKEVGRFECGHYFSSINLNGSCFSCSLELKDIDMDSITSILNKDDFAKLDDFQSKIHELGYGLKVGDEKYLKGLEYRESIKPVIDKLNSSENLELFAQVQEEEKSWLEDEFSINDDDLENIFDNNYLGYKDRSLVLTVFNSAEECAEDYASSCMEIPTEIENYFDYEKLGEDLIKDSTYYVLEDDRIAYLSM